MQDELTPVHMTWLDRDVSLVSRYEDVLAVLNSPHASVDHRKEAFPVMVPHRKGDPHATTTSFLHTDAPRHTELRRIVMPELTTRRMREMRPQIQQVIDRTIDDMLAGENSADLQSAFSFLIPGTVICMLFGVPLEHAPHLTQLAKRMLYADSTGQIDSAASAEFYAYLSDHLSKRDNAAPIVQRLQSAHDAGVVSVEEMRSVALTVFAGGFETSASMIGTAVFELLRHEGAADQLREADDEAAMIAVNELLRYSSIAHFGLGRLAVSDIELADTTICEGERLAVSLASANHDERRFAHPDQLDLSREDNPHVAFGFGPHQCPGQQLARIEVVLATQTLLRRIPTLHLAVDPGTVVFREEHEIRGPIELPVCW